MNVFFHLPKNVLLSAMVGFWTENGEFRPEKIDLPRHVHTCTVRVHGAGEHQQVPFTQVLIRFSFADAGDSFKS